jgi:hypothetical protein
MAQPDLPLALQDDLVSELKHASSMANINEDLPLPGQLVLGDFRLADETADRAEEATTSR